MGAGVQRPHLTDTSMSTRVIKKNQASQERSRSSLLSFAKLILPFQNVVHKSMSNWFRSEMNREEKF